MTKRIFWKKGMRLTDEIMKASDVCTLESLAQAYSMATNGRLGLLSSNDRFHISVNFNKGTLDVESLSCKAVTRNGGLIDIEYATNYTGYLLNNRVALPNDGEPQNQILVITVTKEWKETLQGYCEPIYNFSLMPEGNSIDDNSFPIARIVYDISWHIDDSFVPPCLLVSSHFAYESLYGQFNQIVKQSSQRLNSICNYNYKVALSVWWPTIECLRISMDKQEKMMTPELLLENIQKYVAAFVCGCALEDNLNLTDEDVYRRYIEAPVTIKDMHTRIKEGVALAYIIVEKLMTIQDVVKEVFLIPAPTVDESHFVKKCTNSKVRVPIINNCAGSIVHFTIDGSEPTMNSEKGDVAVFASGFIGGRGKEERDKIVTLKVKSFKDGAESAANTYQIKLQKDVKHWIEI